MVKSLKCIIIKKIRNELQVTYCGFQKNGIKVGNCHILFENKLNSIILLVVVE
ncbi:unnamed protein product [Paramecium sonneborni]|uniref:Uncharacterized protein n=1 Tax=Paramecium sonneborni TaxID=65129 RepID=A0A8S1Q6D4_9CILI|nr:unnamed protein product [Paramecium sonneborni]